MNRTVLLIVACLLPTAACPQRIRAVVEGPHGFIYLLTDADDGRIVRLEPIS